MEQSLRVWLCLAHAEATDKSLTRDDRAEAGLVEDALAEAVRKQELSDGQD